MRALLLSLRQFLDEASSVFERGKFAIVNFHVELEVQPQAAGIPIARADECPQTVDDH